MRRRCAAITSHGFPCQRAATRSIPLPSPGMPGNPLADRAHVCATHQTMFERGAVVSLGKGRQAEKHEPRRDDQPITTRGALDEMNRWHERARRAEKQAEVLAKALDQFFQGDWMVDAKIGKRLRQLEESTKPTLQALGYPKEET